MARGALLIAGTGSGVGKTSITLGLIAALKRRGLVVQSFKVGPDFLDPTWHRLASGRPCYNLDGWMCGEQYVRHLFAEKSADADIAIVEGVMGLFDGADPTSSIGSSAEIARWLGLPVLLVVNSHGVARTLAATVKGFCSFEEGVRIAGIIANQSGSARHVDWLAESLQAAALPPLVGALPRNGLPTLPSRHLGLVTAGSATLTPELLQELADRIEQQLPLDPLLELAATAPQPKRSSRPSIIPKTAVRIHEGYEVSRRCNRLQGIHNSPKRLLLSRSEQSVFLGVSSCTSWITEFYGNVPAAPVVRIGVAQDAAFHFYYPDNLEALATQGAELVPFSPLQDATLPTGLDGIYLGGGYPEEHAARLAANNGMLTELRAFIDSGRPVYAECGGLMYLSRGIELLDGSRHRMLGVLPLYTRMLPKRKALGYVEVTLQQDSLLGTAGAVLRGHEFHYSEIIEAETGHWARPYQSVTRNRGLAGCCGYQQGNLLASYIHLQFAAHPHAAAQFIQTCRRYHAAPTHP